MKRCLATIATAALMLLATLSNADSGRGRNKKLYAVPTPGETVIDGKLDDWDWSGHILSFVSEETKMDRNARFAVMYDDEALYFAAEVVDESPMMNRHDPRADADKAWMGDCLQFRLVTDRTQPYPFVAGNLGNADPKKEEGQPLHLMIWYFTDGKEPALQIHKSMAMDPAREAWAPHGVVPPDQFQAAYRKGEDGKSYILEYRVPWETLNAEDTHPVGGDIVTATVQFLWSDGTGLNLAKAGVTYDIMSSPGFPWQTTDCWGKLLFRKQGDVPRSWVEPMEEPELPQPLDFTYDLPRDGEVSIALFDEDNRIVRHIVAQGPRKKGTVTEKWDGLTMQGKPLPLGTYRWKGLVHDPIKTRYVMSIGNSGQPAWKTADGAGGWGGDYGPPTAACQAGERMILGWTGHESGWGIIGTDLNGKKLWGAKQKDAAYIASDGERFFAPGEHGGQDMNVYSVKNGQPLAFGNGRQGLKPPAGNDDDEANRPTGVAYHDNVLYVSFGKRGLIGAYDADSGNLQKTYDVASAGRLAAMTDGTLLALNGDTIVKVRNNKVSPFLPASEHVSEPKGIAVDKTGNVYVANWGHLQCVTVFDASGKYQRTIGRRGGRPREGLWEKLGMLQPAGIHVDTNGVLWVPEAITSPKRLSRWDATTGTLQDEFFGACSYSPFVWIDPDNPKEAFFDNTIWNVDLEKGTWYPKSVFYRRRNGNMINSGSGGFFYPYRVFTGNNGHQYAVSNWHGFGPVFWIRDGNLFKPLYFMFKNYPNHVLMNYPPFANMKDKKDEYPPGKYYYWADGNGDQEAQLSELAEIPVKPRRSPPFFMWMDRNLNLYGNNAVYRPASIGEDGVPVYDFTNPETLDIQPHGAQNWVDPEAKTIWTWGRSDTVGFAQYGLAHRKMAWAYPPLKSWRAAINDGIPQPGNLVGPTCPMGTAGRFSGLISYFGTAELVRDDGLFVAQVFEHGAKGNNGPNIFYVEFLAGQLLQPTGSDKFYILAGDQDCRVMEVLGLDTMRDLPGGTYVHTREKADTAAKAFREYEATIARGQPLSLARGGVAGLAGADGVRKTVDAKRSFQVSAGYDEDHLYFRYDVTSPSPLVNAVTDPKSIFKGGNLIDLQIAANPNADPERKIPAPGDARLLISKQPDGETWSVLLRPRVEGFQGERIKLESPTGHELFDVIEPTDRVDLQDLRKTKDGFRVTVAVPRNLIGLPELKPGDTVRMDVGYIFGDPGGTNAAVRAYWHNNSFTANVVNDVPHESRLEPNEWGTVLVE